MCINALPACMYVICTTHKQSLGGQKMELQRAVNCHVSAEMGTQVL